MTESTMSSELEKLAGIAKKRLNDAGTLGQHVDKVEAVAVGGEVVGEPALGSRSRPRSRR
jgi:hypothetical protein